MKTWSCLLWSDIIASSSPDSLKLRFPPILLSENLKTKTNKNKDAMDWTFCIQRTCPMKSSDRHLQQLKCPLCRQETPSRVEEVWHYETGSDHRSRDVMGVVSLQKCNPYKEIMSQPKAKKKGTTAGNAKCLVAFKKGVLCWNRLFLYLIPCLDLRTTRKNQDNKASKGPNFCLCLDICP